MIWCFWWMPKKPDIGRPTSNINPTLHLFAETGCSESTNFGRRDEDRGWESRTSWIVWKSWEGWHLTFDWVDTFWILWTVLLVQLDIAWGAAFNFRDQERATGNFFSFHLWMFFRLKSGMASAPWNIPHHSTKCIRINSTRTSVAPSRCVHADLKSTSKNTGPWDGTYWVVGHWRRTDFTYSGSKSFPFSILTGWGSKPLNQKSDFDRAWGFEKQLGGPIDAHQCPTCHAKQNIFAKLRIESSSEI